MVSYIVPIYDAEKWLSVCVDSILKQEYQDFEILLINDGSKDSSLAICNEYASKDKRIIVADIPNRGVSIARNVGIELSSGTYLQFVDSDDTLESNMTSDLVKCMELHQADLVVSGSYIVDVDKNEKLLNGKMLSLVLEKREFYDMFWKLLAETLQFETIWNKLFLREKVVGNNCSFPKGVHYGEDVIFNTYYYKLCDKVALIETAHYNYHIRLEDSSSLALIYKPYIIDDLSKVISAMAEFAKLCNISPNKYLCKWLLSYRDVVVRQLHRYNENPTIEDVQKQQEKFFEKIKNIVPDQWFDLVIQASNSEKLDMP